MGQELGKEDGETVQAQLEKTLKNNKLNGKVSGTKSIPMDADKKMGKSFYTLCVAVWLRITKSTNVLP